mgnify:FL=1
MQGITFYCKKCRKSTRVTYRLTGNDDAPVLLNIDIVCHHCKRVMYLKKYAEKMLKLSANCDGRAFCIYS